MFKTILNLANCFRFKYPQYEFYVEAGASSPGHIVGEVEVFDGDKGDSISLELSGRSSRAFRITREGEIFISDLSYMKGKEVFSYFLVATWLLRKIPPRLTWLSRRRTAAPRPGAPRCPWW